MTTMPEHVIEKRLQLAVKDGFKRNRRHVRAAARGIKQYVGHYYRDEYGTEGEEPLNMIYHVIRSLVPNLVMKNPINKVTTQFGKDYKDYAYMLGLTLDQVCERINLKGVIRRAIVDALFCMGIVRVGLNASDSLMDFGDMRTDPGQVYADNVDFEDFVYDPACRRLEEAAFVGYRSRIPRQILLDDSNCDHDIVAKLPRSMVTDMKRPSRISGNKDLGNMMIELQDYVDIVEVYVPDAQAMLMIPDPDQFMSERYIKVTDYYGPSEGPFRYLTLSQPVPGNPVPPPPVNIWYDLHIMANRLMKKQMDRAERQKSLIVADPSANDMVQDMIEGEDGEVIWGHPKDVSHLSTSGAEEGTDATISRVHMWFNYLSGNPDQLAGVAGDAETATQASILAGNASVGIEDTRGMVYEFAANTVSGMAWFIHYDPFLKHNLTATRRPWVSESQYDWGSTITLTREQRRGEHFDFVFTVKPKSMGSIDPAVLSKRILEFATKVVPAIITAMQVAMSMGVQFNAQKAITDLGDQLDLTEHIQEWFDDPEFMQRIQLMMMMGPQAEGQAVANMGGVIQQNGAIFGGASPNKSAFNQQAQELAGYMQSSIQHTRA
jgi:hypothetical protein